MISVYPYPKVFGVVTLQYEKPKFDFKVTLIISLCNGISKTNCNHCVIETYAFMKGRYSCILEKGLRTRKPIEWQILATQVEVSIRDYLSTGKVIYLQLSNHRYITL